MASERPLDFHSITHKKGGIDELLTIANLKEILTADTIAELLTYDLLNALGVTLYLGEVIIGGAFTGTSQTTADVTGMSVTVTTHGGDIKLEFTGERSFDNVSPLSNENSARSKCDWVLDIDAGTSTITRTEGIDNLDFESSVTTGAASAGTAHTHSVDLAILDDLTVYSSATITWFITGLAAGSHTFKLRYDLDDANFEVNIATGARLRVYEE